MKRNKGLGFVIMAVILIGCTLLSLFSLTIYDEFGLIAFKIPGTSDIRLGIDIRGGVDAVFQPEESATNVTNDDLNNARSIIELRLDKNNITDRDVTIDYAKQRILVRFPWKSTETTFNPQDALEELGQMGRLTFKYSNGNTILEGSEVAKAYDDTESGKPVVRLVFTADGAKKFAEATQNVINKTLPSATAPASPSPSPSASASADAAETVDATQIAIYLDETLISHPVVKTAILQGDCIIENIGTTDEAKKLANLIASGSLPFKLVSKSNNSISPTMGKSALDMMVLSGLIAFLMVCVFMVLVYRLPGSVACFALLGQIVGQLLVLSISQFTLTLPGIAGIILSIGMGVDANVISAERVKEELYTGKSVRAALDAGYSKAFSAVADGNVTVAIVAVLLWILGTGPMISFGFTLFIGVIFNFICGVGVSKIMLKSVTGLKIGQNKWLFGFKGGAENAKNI